MRPRPWPTPTWPWTPGLEILPVVNKIDLPSADPDRVCHEIEDVIGIPAMDAPRISAKTGENIEEVMERIVTDIPAPRGDENAPLRALIFDSYYDAYRGVIVYVRIKDGTVKPGDTIRMMATGGEFTVVECGFLRATNLEPAEALYAGEVGYIAASIKDVRQARVGDTVTLKDRARRRAFAGLPGGAAHGVLRHLPRRRRPLHRICGTPWKSCSSTTPPSPLSRRPRWPWALASGAAFWGCCTWRSSRSGWSGSTIWISSPPPPAWFTGKAHRRQRDSPSTTPPTTRTPPKLPVPEEPICNAHIYWPPRNMWATSWSCARSGGACSRT